jgi:hypothetical protein
LTPPEWITRPWNLGVDGSTLEIAVRLSAAAVAGLAVILIRLARRTKDSPPDNGLSSTLVLLCILAAIVTEVIGNNLARAFGLVGALSIVRFRTPIEDSRDTAFVMFAMAIGMAIGSGYIIIAAVGVAVIGVVALIAKLLSVADAVVGKLDVRVPPEGEPAGFVEAFPATSPPSASREPRPSKKAAATSPTPSS